MAFEITITPAMKRQFASEADEHLDNLEKSLLRLEQAPGDSQAVDAAFRAVHSIKGNSDYLGFSDVNALAHGLEDLMDDLRSRREALTKATLALLFECLDRLREMNGHITDDDYQELDVSDLTARIDRAKAAPHKPATAQVPTRPALDVKAVFKRSAGQHLSYLRKRCRQVVEGASAKGVKARLSRVLKTFSNSAAYVGADEVATLVEQMGQTLAEERSLYRRTARRLLELTDDVEAALIAFSRPTSEQTTSAETDALHSIEFTDREMKVAPAKMDAFMNRAAELTIAKNALNYLCSAIPAEVRSGEWSQELRRTAAVINKLSDLLQAEVMAIRLVRINWLFDRLPRILRDLARQGRKQAVLKLRGGHTEIDRKVIEQLADPLVHLIRNAVHHGIESPQQRSRLGKAESGTVTVSARQKGSEAVIDVMDDGRGIDIKAVKKAALEKKFVSPSELGAMSDEEIQGLIFAPGLSTAKGVTLVSGRGVGLDVVLKNLNRIGGSVAVTGEPGRGTRVRLRVPVSMALQETLLTEANGEQYAFPFTAVVETLTVHPDQIQVLNGHEAIPYCGTVLDLSDLGQLLGLRPQERLGAGPPEKDLPVVVVASQGRVRGIAVERVMGRQAILARPLEHHLTGIQELSGAALLGDGSIALILDPAGMV